MALKHAAVASVGRETITLEPSGNLAETASPTVIESSATRLLSAAALGVVPGVSLPPLLQAARARAPTLAAPTKSALRREMSEVAECASLAMVHPRERAHPWFRLWSPACATPTEPLGHQSRFSVMCSCDAS